MVEFNPDQIESQIQEAAKELNRVVKSTADHLSSNRIKAPKLYEKPENLKKTGKIVLGFLLAGGSFVFLFTGGFITMSRYLWVATLSCYLLLGTGAAGLYLGLSGLLQQKRVNRLKTYLQILGNKTVISLKELSEETGRSVRYLQKDLEKMKEKRYFLQAHFTEDKTQFITSDATYKQYRLLMDSEKEKKEEREKQDQGLKEAGISQEGLRILTEGQDYIRKIHEANDRLPGEQVSLKLDRLEGVITRIMEELKAQPDKTFELRKLMNYYLPTTEKLLKAYLDLEEEPYKTPAMEKTQKEIEETLDSINEAFEELLNQLFSNRAMDVSADISVLHTMIKQDHLQKDFKNQEE